MAPLALGPVLATAAAAQPADYRSAFEHVDQELKGALRAEDAIFRLKATADGGSS